MVVFHTEVSCLYIRVIKVRYSCFKYIKIKASLITKLGDNVIETRSYKINREVLESWKIYEGL